MISKNCSTKSVIKLLNEIIARDGVPQEIKSDLASAFKSAELKKFCEEWGIRQKFGTPYLQFSVGIVERHLRTFQDFLKTYLIEDADFKKAIAKALYVMRFTVHKSLNVTPFEKHYGRKPVRKLDNLLNLEFPEKDLLESVRDSSGKVVAENFYSTDENADMVEERTYGRSRGEKDLREVLKTKKTVGNFAV